ncbi:MAG: hypothetical protein HDQ88_07200 [Clostridia bacterium]|nr:hypothetical protein [Clostridia bacterium]
MKEKETATLDQVIKDYNNFMGIIADKEEEDKENDEINAHVYFERFSIYDKKMISQTTAKLI